MKEFRDELDAPDSGGKTNTERGIPPRLSPSDSRELIQLAGAAWEFLEANEKGTQTKENAGVIKEAVRSIQRHAIAPTKLQAIMGVQPDPMKDAWYEFMIASLSYQLYLENIVSQIANDNVKDRTWKRREQYRESIHGELQYIVEAAKSAVGARRQAQGVTNKLLAAVYRQTEKKPVASEPSDTAEPVITPLA